MDEPWSWVVLAAIVGIAIALWINSYWAEKERTRQLDSVASRLGFELWPESQPQLVEHLAFFHLFSQGHSKKAWNVMNGRAGNARVQLFDYKYVTGSGKSSCTWKQTVVLFESDRLRLPAFSLRPHGFLDGVASLFGQQDIEFPTHPDFSSAYLLQGQDEERIRAIFTEPVVAYYTRHPGLCVEGHESQLICFHKGARVELEQIPDFFQEGLDILDLWIHKEGVADNLDLIGLDLV